jgi:hypothetical protein
MTRGPDRARLLAGVRLQRLVAHQRFPTVELVLGLLTVLPLAAWVTFDAWVGATATWVEQDVAALARGTLAALLEPFFLLGGLLAILVGE